MSGSPMHALASTPADPTQWRDDALCLQTDPGLFFPETGESTEDAKKVCATCDVQAECLGYALQNDERYGVWGGASPRERAAMRRRRES